MAAVSDEANETICEFTVEANGSRVVNPGLNDLA